MTTRDVIVDQVLANLGGFLTEQELCGTLSGDITSGDGTFTVTGSVFTDASVAGFRPGLIEVGDELMYVRAVNPSTGQFTGVVRGWGAATGSAWASGTLVRDNPRVPKIAVKLAVNHAISALFPAVFRPVSAEVTAVAGQSGYDLPAATEAVLAVRSRAPSATAAWVEVDQWRFDRQGPSTSSTGRLLTVPGVAATRKIQAITACGPLGLFTTSSGATDETYTTVTGLPAWTMELVVLGACYRLTGFLDAGHVAGRTAEGDLLAQQSPVGAARELSAYYFSLYEDLLNKARSRMLTEALGVSPFELPSAQPPQQGEQRGN